jgi:hypothetical protein
LRGEEEAKEIIHGDSEDTETRKSPMMKKETPETRRS